MIDATRRTHPILQAAPSPEADAKAEAKLVVADAPRMLPLPNAGVAAPATVSTIEFGDESVRRIERHPIEMGDAGFVPYSGPSAAKFPRGFPLGVGSGLCFAGFDGSGRLLFRSVTDRGPNGDAPKYLDAGGVVRPTKVFAAETFEPRINLIRVRPGYRAELVESKPIMREGAAVSGRPIPPGEVGATGEIGLTESLQPIAFDPHGMDPESIAIDHNGDWWIADEYGPFLSRIDPETREVLEMLSPGRGLPDVLKERPANRGFEACTVLPNGSIVAMLQSPFVHGTEREPFMRIVIFDPETRKTRMLGARVDPANYLDTKEAKIGDICAIDDDRLLVIEQGIDKNGVMQTWLARIDLRKATELEAPDAELAPIDRFLDLRKYGWTAEKCEALAIIDEKTIAIANDNDFGMLGHMEGVEGDLALTTIDVNGTFKDATGKVLEPRYSLVPGPLEGSTSELWVVHLARPL